MRLPRRRRVVPCQQVFALACLEQCKISRIMARLVAFYHSIPFSACSTPFTTERHSRHRTESTLNATSNKPHSMQDCLHTTLDTIPNLVQLVPSLQRELANRLVRHRGEINTLSQGREESTNRRSVASRMALFLSWLIVEAWICASH
jgi:hypothetical protein